MRIRTSAASALILGSVLCGFLLAPSKAIAVPAVFQVPPNDGFITDMAQVLSDSEESDLETSLRQYQQQTSNEIAILILQSLQGNDIRDIGVQVGRAWGVGTKEKNNGILLVIALEERSMSIETGYGLEGAVPDVVAKGIIEDVIAPRFREGKYAQGLAEAIDALEKHIGGEYTADRYATSQDDGGIVPFLFFVVFAGLNVLGSFLGRSRSWWMGGVIGVGFGLVLTVFFGWWLSIPALVILGLLFDFIVSRMPRSGRRRPWWWGGGGFGGGGSFGGGGGGFGGGSFGGGGASGKW